MLSDEHCLEIHFTEGVRLVVQRRQDGLAVAVLPAGATAGRGDRPTARQREYLEFIAQYIGRFGVSPAESDIRRRFLVSAPTVNQMMQTLERRGFITRRPGVPRSIRIVHRPESPSSA